MSSINFLIASFCSLKLCIKYKFIDHIINNIRLTQNLTCVLKAYRTCNSTVKFSKYVLMLMIFSKVVVLDYNQFYN